MEMYFFIMKTNSMVQLKILYKINEKFGYFC